MKRILFLGALASLFLFTQCKKSGCTDELADNFDDTAELNDESCEYTTDLVFYLNDARKTFYDDKDNFFAPFHLYIDGNKIGELSVSAANFQTYSTEPTCEASSGGLLKHKHTWGDKTGNVIVTIKDQLDNDHGTITVNVDKLFSSDSSCKAVLL